MIAIAAISTHATTKPASAPARVAEMRAARSAEPTPRMSTSSRGLTVRVTADGQPVADAAVEIADGSGATLAMRSDREGVVHVTELARGPHELWATADALASPIARIDDFAVQVELALAPAARVRGHVTADGAVPGTGSIQLVPLGADQVVRTAPLDDHGELAIAGLPLGRWRVEASVPGFVQTAPQIFQVTERSATLDVHVVRAGSVHGTAVDSRGEPVANAVIVLSEQTGALPVQPSLELASTGMRWVHPLAGARKLPVIDDARFGASRPGARPAECNRGHCGIDIGNERGSVVHAAADGEIASLFPDGRTEAGRVVVIHHGHGLKSYYMHLDELRPGLEVGQPIHAGDPVGTLGSTGFSRPLPHLHFAITYEAAGRTWYLDPEPILRQAVVLATPRAYVPVDLAAAAGEPHVLPAVPVLQRITTDAHGAFRVDGLAPGSYAAGAFASDFAPGSTAGFTVRSGEDAAGVVVTLSAGLIVDGRVLGRDGPVDGATIIASAGFGETAHKVAMTTTDRHGEFSLRALGGKVTLSVAAAGYGGSERTLSLDDSDAHRPRRHEDFALTIEDAQLRGQVFAPEGGAAAGVAVRVVDGPTRRSTTTDAQGRFVLRVATGHYVIELAGGDTPSKRVAADSDRWTEVRLEAGGALRCLVRDAQTRAPLAAARVELTGPGGQSVRRLSDAQGMVELKGLAAGDWSVTARAGSYAPSARPVAIRAARVADDITLELAHAATVEGVVRDRYGRRVAGARVSIGAATTVADRDGNFRLAEVAAGSALVEANLDARHGELPIQLAPGDLRLEQTVVLADP